jgi:hypothetical protein
MNTDDPDNAGNELARRRASDTLPLVILVNGVTVGLGGLYASTQSVMVTAIAAGLVGTLALTLRASRSK